MQPLRNIVALWLPSTCTFAIPFLLSHRIELGKTLEADARRVELGAVAGPDHGCIWDHELVAAVMKIAGCYQISFIPFRARAAVAADDDVVVHGNAERLGDLDDRLRHRVGLRGIVRGVFVQEHSAAAI